MRNPRRRRRAPQTSEEGVVVKPATVEVVTERAFRLLAARDRSIEELRQRLLQREDATAEVVAQVIDKLIGYNYLDDERFARDYSLSKIRGRAMGRRRLERDLLQQKHLPEALVTRTLDELFARHPEEQLVAEALANHLRAQGPPATQNDVQKLTNKLMRRGFDPGAVREQTRQLWEEARREQAEAAEDDSDQEALQEAREAEMDDVIAHFIRVKGTPRDFKEARKLSERLMRRGFPFDLIRQKVDPLWKS